MVNLPPNPRILIVKPSAIGDVVHALPVLNLLRRRYPAAHISWLVTPACAGLLDGHPQLDAVVRFDRKRFGHAWRDPSAMAGLATFHRELFRRHFDLVIDLQGLFRSGWLSFSTGAKVRVGQSTDREFGWAFQSHVAPVGGRDRHAVDRYLSVAEFLGLGTSPVEFVFPTDDADRAAVEPLLPAGPFAVFLPATHWPTKRWPTERFAALVSPLRERFGLASVVAGGPDAEPVAGADTLAGRTTLRQLVAGCSSGARRVKVGSRRTTNSRSNAPSDNSSTRTKRQSSICSVEAAEQPAPAALSCRAERRPRSQVAALREVAQSCRQASRMRGSRTARRGRIMRVVPGVDDHQTADYLMGYRWLVVGFERRGLLTRTEASLREAHFNFTHAGRLFIYDGAYGLNGRYETAQAALRLRIDSVTANGVAWASGPNIARDQQEAIQTLCPMGDPQLFTAVELTWSGLTVTLSAHGVGVVIRRAGRLPLP